MLAVMEVLDKNELFRDMRGLIREEVRSEIRNEFGLFKEHMDVRFTAVDKEFKMVYERFHGIDTRLDSIDIRLDRVETRLDVHTEMIGNLAMEKHFHRKEPEE